MKQHKHIYDDEGNQLCCTLEEKIEKTSDAMIRQEDDCCSGHDHHSNTKAAHQHDDDHGHDHDHDHSGGMNSLFNTSFMSLGLLLAGLAMDHLFIVRWFEGYIRIGFYLLAYIPVGWPVLKDAWKSILKGQVFSEFFLMALATVGAFAIGEYPESVAVMLFYTIGEAFQTLAVKRAKLNIKTLLDQRPDEVTVIDGERTNTMMARKVAVGSVLRLSPGEKAALDGILLTENASFDTAALTGESVPADKKKGDKVYAGMINLSSVAHMEVSTVYEDSKLSNILQMVQDAATRKAPTELFIRKFAKIYTPIVVFLAIGICFLPALVVEGYLFREWLYRALVFLVISCPCALVISIPLGYFGGIGAAGRNGILVKGGNYLDILASVRHVIVDKTGTMTEGSFKVQEVFLQDGFDKREVLALVNALQSQSTHPVATAISRYTGNDSVKYKVEQGEEIAGHGMKGNVAGREVLVGNFKLLSKYGVPYTAPKDDSPYTIIAIAIDGKYAGHLTISDTLKKESVETVKALNTMSIGVTMLSGDKTLVVRDVASKTGITDFYGDLLPQDKVDKTGILKEKHQVVAFAGDGVNDAPVLALSDVGIAMGGLGSDMAIESADVVIQDDNPLKIAKAIQIGKQTKRIVWQNISLAFIVKAVVLIIGAGGLATMWEAVFADVGVALLAILNAVRIQHMKF